VGSSAVNMGRAWKARPGQPANDGRPCLARPACEACQARHGPHAWHVPGLISGHAVLARPGLLGQRAMHTEPAHVPTRWACQII